MFFPRHALFLCLQAWSVPFCIALFSRGWVVRNPSNSLSTLPYLPLGCCLFQQSKALPLEGMDRSTEEYSSCSSNLELKSAAICLEQLNRSAVSNDILHEWSWSACQKGDFSIKRIKLSVTSGPSLISQTRSHFCVSTMWVVVWHISAAKSRIQFSKPFLNVRSRLVPESVLELRFFSGNCNWNS